MATATSYSLGDRPSERGARESLDNTLRRTAVEATPMFSLLPRGPKAQAMYTEWLVDDLSPVSFPGVIDGKPLSYTGDSTGDFVDKTTDRARLGARVQQLERTFAVSPQASAVSVAGPSDLYSASKARAMVELKRDIEAMICSDNSSRVGSGSQGDLCAGLGAWTDPANFSEFGGGNADTDLDANADIANKRKYRAVSGSRISTETLTENSFRNMLQSIYENHGNSASYRLVAGPGVLNQVTGFSRINVPSDAGHPSYQLTQNVGDGVLRLSVQEYISDWGRVFLVPSLLAGFSSANTTFGDDNRNRGYLIPGDSFIQLRYLEDMKAIDLVDPDGGGKRGLVRAMLTLTPTAGSKALGSLV